jgi:hypothetical protein
MTAEVTRTLALLDMLEAHIDQLIHTKQDHPQKHELLVIKRTHPVRTAVSLLLARDVGQHRGT